MKVVFAGPTIHGLTIDWTGIELRRPAENGDLEKAVADGARVVGLVDGHYQQVGAVWHKEILFALGQGVVVYGASSMGALRAAECERYGMKPIGDIARRYCTGEYFDDADVALLNGPAELSFAPLTEPLLTVDATLCRLEEIGILTAGEREALGVHTRNVFFGDRTIPVIFSRVKSESRSEELQAAYMQNRVDPKAQDAFELIEAVRRGPGDLIGSAPPNFPMSPFWDRRTVRSDVVTSS